MIDLTLLSNSALPWAEKRLTVADESVTDYECRLEAENGRPAALFIAISRGAFETGTIFPRTPPGVERGWRCWFSAAPGRDPFRAVGRSFSPEYAASPGGRGRGPGHIRQQLAAKVMRGRPASKREAPAHKHLISLRPVRAVFAGDDSPKKLQHDHRESRHHPAGPIRRRDYLVLWGAAPISWRKIKSAPAI